MPFLANKTQFSPFASCRRGGIWLSGILISGLLLPASVAQPDSSGVELLTGAEAKKSLQQLRSVTLQAVPFGQAVANLQTSLRYAIVVEHTIDPGQPVTLATGMQASDGLLRRLAASVGADVSFTENFAMVGRPESVKRLRTILELRRKDLQSLRTKLNADVYRRCFEPMGNGWPKLMRPNDYVREQIREVGLSVPESEALPYDLWSAQVLPAVGFVDRMSLILNQYDLTFAIDDVGGVRFLPVEERPFLRRRLRVPADRRAAVEGVLAADGSVVQANWSGSRVTIDGSVELLQRVEAAIRNEISVAAKSDLRTQKFTMTIPFGSTVSRVLESLKASGVDVRIQGSSQAATEQFLQRKVELRADGLLGTEFFPALFKTDGVTVRVEAESVLIRF